MTPQHILSFHCISSSNVNGHSEQGGEAKENQTSTLQTPMDPHTAEVTIKAYLSEIRIRLDEAAIIAKAAEACALAGSVDKGVEVSHDIEQLLYEATNFLNVASMIRRLSKE